MRVTLFSIRLKFKLSKPKGIPKPPQNARFRVFTPHDFEIDGEIYRRLFINSSKDDLSTKMKAALRSEYKDEVFDFSSPFDETIITHSFEPAHYEKFLILGKANGLIKQVSEGRISFYPV
jgi:hypothetical protein